jgi:hypothetical protein
MIIYEGKLYENWRKYFSVFLKDRVSHFKGKWLMVEPNNFLFNCVYLICVNIVMMNYNGFN